ncbi:MAG: aldo/keto reductase [Candidatus Omnitrophica bacterium]|nr:aldo/keto reductase [Candidatus Omnitrophota bacterium]
MRYRIIPGTHLKISEIGFKLGSLDGSRWDTIPDKAAHHLMRYALDRGINFFDTADIYGGGRVESLLGAAFREERERVVMATKFGYESLPADTFSKSLKGMKNFTPRYLPLACEDSLRRLRTDHIDLYQIHHPDLEDGASEDLVAALEKLRKQGKVIAWGVALDPGSAGLEEGKFFLKFRKTRSLQLTHPLAEREAREEIFLEAKRYGACVISRSPIPEGFEKIEDLNRLDRGKCRGRNQAVVQYLLKNSATASVLLEMDSEEKINEFAGTCEGPALSPEETHLLEAFGQKMRPLRTDAPKHPLPLGEKLL